MPAKYTTLVRDVCEYYAGINSTDKGGINAVLDNSWDKIFSNNWEIFAESYRKVLCEKILRKYFTREICAETVGLWKLWMDATMCEIMPMYNQLYETTLIKYDVFNNVDVTTTFNKSGKENTSNSGSSNTTDSGNVTDNGTTNGMSEMTHSGKVANTSTTWNLHSDTPQGGITGIENEQYLSDATKNTTNGNTTTNNTDTGSNSINTNETRKTSNTQKRTNTDTGNRNTTEEWTQKIFGKNNGQSNSSLLKEFRENILNIDQMIINDLKVLFFNLW